MSCHSHLSKHLGVVKTSCCFACAVVLSLACQTALAQADDPFNLDKKTAGEAAPGVISSAEFVDAPVTTVFRMISDMTGWTIVMSPEVSRQPPKINIWIKNLSPEEILDQVTVMGGLTMQRNGATVRVMTFEEYARTYGVEQRRIHVKHASARNIADALKPFAAEDDRARILADEQSNSVILLLPKPLINSLAKLAEELDVPYERGTIELVKLQHLQASTIVPELERFLTGSQTISSRYETAQQSSSTSAAGRVEAAAGTGYALRFMIEPRLNVIVLRGSDSDVARAVDLVSKLDVPGDLTIATYEFRYVNAKDIFKTVQDIMQERSSETASTGVSRLKLSLAEETNRIIAEGSPADHARLAKLVAALDVPLPPGSSATRVYRLTNATAEEVAKVITGLIEDTDRDRAARAATDEMNESQANLEGGKEPAGSRPSDTAPEAGDAPATEIPARVMAVPEINAVVIRASAAEHEEFARVIEEIDKPRDQVILEVTVVTVRADTSFQLGVELGGTMLGDATQRIGFTSFGVGTPDPTTGAIRIAEPPPLGLNYAILSFAIFDYDDVSLVLKALKTVGDVRVTSAPKILVQDNAEAMISQLNQEPYESTSQGTSSTISTFGGFVDAGTQLIVTPHISRQNWVRIDYEVLMSTFGQRTAEQLAANLPPPKRETKAVGTARVPAEHVVVLGGLVGDRRDKTVDSVPILGDIPLLGALFRKRSSSSARETMYIFIRPVILRDPSFQDLIYLSSDDIREARLKQDEYPTNPLKTFAPRDNSEQDAIHGTWPSDRPGVGGLRLPPAGMRRAQPH